MKVQRIIEYDELPKIFRNNNRKLQASLGEVWLIDQSLGIDLIAPQEIIGHISITASNNNDREFYCFFISEIIYKFKGHWKIRNILLEDQHPAEYISTTLPPSHEIPVFKLFIDLYYDDFGTYRNVYHSLGGVYIQFGNMPIFMRKLLKNHFLLGFVSFGGNFDEFIQSFTMEMKALECGQIMNIQGQNCWITAGLGVVTADLPQGNDLAGIKRHGANKGCRTCQVSKEQSTNDNLNIIELRRYQHITNEQFREVSSVATLQGREQLMTKYGLRNKVPILTQLIWNQHLQTPHDVYHATAGKIARLLKLTINLFSLEGQRMFTKTWKEFEHPKQWSRLPNPISHYESFMMSDYLRLSMVMPFILNRFLKTSHLKDNELVKIQRRICANRINLVPKSLIKCWVLASKSMKLVFKNEYSEKDYEDLQQSLEMERKILTQVIIFLFDFINYFY
ncbi:MAG TPA: hypothetical protein VF455_09595 [Chryseobacterium sp.]